MRHSVCVTITGKVYFDDEEMQYVRDMADKPEEVTQDEIVQEIVNEKLGWGGPVFPKSEEHFKLNEIIPEFATFTSYP